MGRTPPGVVGYSLPREGQASPLRHEGTRKAGDPARRVTNPLTIEYVKAAMLTVRVPSSLRRRIESMALREGRSLAQQVRRLIEQGIRASAERGQARPLSGFFAEIRVPPLSEFLRTRATVSASISRRVRTPA